jgi:precorrin-6A/cobalt-precorrin-6A reductase
MDSQRGDAAVSRTVASAGGGLEGDMIRILILGGTTEARQLAERLAGRGDLDVTLSLAGRTASPVPHAVPVRIGGFGGAAALAGYLTEHRINALIDATHPYAIIISANAAAAARQAAVPFVVLRRPPWTAIAGDRWTEVSDTAAAVKAIGEQSRNVFIALGRNDLAPFARAPQHRYLIRSVDPVDPPLALPHARYITARGPFSEADDRALMAAHEIEVVVSKNSGGGAAYGKIAAARALGITVIMVHRPPTPDTPAVETVEEAIAWLDHAVTSAAARAACRQAACARAVQ